MISLDSLMNRMERHNRFDNLHPRVAEAGRELMKKAYAEGIPIQITQGYRSIAYQNSLYAQGRTKSGNIVTNAKGGQSYHNYGLAIDFVLLSSDGNNALWTVNSKWRRVAQIGKDLGFEWGGDWTSFKDYPHLQMSFGLSIRDLQNGKRPPQHVVSTKKNIIEKGDRGSSVTNLQKSLKEMGYKLSVDGIFGSETEKIVKEFQKENSLEVDGIVGPNTSSKINRIISRNVSDDAIVKYPGKLLKVGSKGKNVERIQRALGFKGNAIDGIYGSNTARYVKAYQKRKGLSVDGIVGKNTWNTLF